MADDIKLVKFGQGSAAGFKDLTKDADTIYFLTDTKRIFLGATEYTRPVDSALNGESTNSIENKAVVAALNEYLQMGKDSAALLYLPLAGGAITGNLSVGGTLTVTGATTLNSTLKIKGHTTPASNNTYNLGSSSYKWKNVYATTFTGASFTGTAAKATILATARNFSIKNTAGSGTAVSFDGSGNVKLEVPNLMSGFESIESNKYVVDNKATMQYDSTNDYLYFTFS